MTRCASSSQSDNTSSKQTPGVWAQTTTSFSGWESLRISGASSIRWQWPDLLLNRENALNVFGKSTILRSLFLYMGCTCVCMHMFVWMWTHTLWVIMHGGGVQGRPAVTTEEFCNGFLSYCLRQSPTEHGWPMRANLSLSPQITNYIWLLHGPQIRPSCLPSRHFTDWTLSSAPGSIFLSWKLRAIVFPTFYH